MKAIAAAALAASLMLSPPTQAQSMPVVVELFTSQGCSSCPPADRLLNTLSGRDDVLPLSLHVDYWDYIGWRDPFSRPENADRQRDYARVAGRRMVYTPQMIIDGQEAIVGARRAELDALIERHLAQPPLARLDATRNGAAVSVRLRALKPIEGPLSVILIRFTPEHSTEITRGENAGRFLTYANVVDDWQVIGNWDGQTPYEIRTPVQGPRPAAVLVQFAGPGPIAAAALAR